MTTSSRENDWAVRMRAAMAGDAGAYRQLLVTLVPHIRAVARSRCRSLGAPEDEVEDLVQEVLLTIHLKRGTWDQSKPLGPWIAAITRNKLIDVLRRRGRHITIPIEDFEDSLRAEDPTPALSTRNAKCRWGAWSRNGGKSCNPYRSTAAVPRDRRPTSHHGGYRPRHASSCAQSVGRFLSEWRP